MFIQLLRMLRICAWAFLLVSAIERGSANVSPRSTDMHCNDLCSDVDAYIPTISGKWPTCERGCRFFNIIFLTDGHNISATKDGCHSSCREAYNLHEMKECTAGCDATLDHIIQYTAKNNAFVMADVEIVESEIFVDSQAPAHSIQFKIPETNVRKIPIEELLDEEFVQQETSHGGVYFSLGNCVPHHQKASRLILFHVFILLVIILFLWFVNLLHAPTTSDDNTLTADEKEYCETDLDADDEKSLVEKEEVKIVTFPENDQTNDCKNPKA